MIPFPCCIWGKRGDREFDTLAIFIRDQEQKKNVVRDKEVSFLANSVPKKTNKQDEVSSLANIMPVAMLKSQ